METNNFKISDLAIGDNFKTDKLVGNYIGAGRKGGYSHQWGDGLIYNVVWFNKNDKTQAKGATSYSKEELVAAIRYNHWDYTPIPRPPKPCRLCGHQ